MFKVKDHLDDLEAACAMRDANIGEVLVLAHDRLRGMVTDRDVVGRAVAVGKEVSAACLEEIGSQDVVALSPHDSVDEAVRLMREKAVSSSPAGDVRVRRIPRSISGAIRTVRLRPGGTRRPLCQRTSRHYPRLDFVWPAHLT